MSKLLELTAGDIVAMLYERRNGTPKRGREKTPEWLTFDELRVSSGYTRGEQRVDFWEMNTYPSNNYERNAYEIKISRSDFSAELRKPQKRRPALMLSNRFYFVAPAGIVPIEKLPIDAGLIEVVEKPYGLTLKKTVEAPWLDTEPPPWGFVASLIRRVDREYAKTETT